jgi:YfiH family protein
MVVRGQFTQFDVNCLDGAKAGFELFEARPPLADVKTIRQVHGTIGHQVSRDTTELVEGDWLWTTERHLPIGVMVADCTAILLQGQSSIGGDLVAAVHAGWRGSAAGIIPHVIEHLKLKSFSAWLSPSICQEHFEVGEDVVESFGQAAQKYFQPKNSGKYLMDLKCFQVDQLKNSGAKTFPSSLCTFCQPEFVSYRQSQGNISARHLAWISLD